MRVEPRSRAGSHETPPVVPWETAKEPSKSAFIRANPRLKIAELIEKARTQGIAITENYVQVVREMDRKPTPARKTPTLPPAAKKAAPRGGRAGKNTGSPETVPPTAKTAMNKTEFIRSHPDLTAADVVEKANAAGLVMNKPLVHQIRSRDAQNNKDPQKPGKMRKPTGAVAAMSVAPKAEAPKNTATKKNKGRSVKTPSKAELKALIKKELRKVKERPVHRLGLLGLLSFVSPETTFRQMVIDLGVVKAKQLIEEVERGIENILAGK